MEADKKFAEGKDKTDDAKFEGSDIIVEELKKLKKAFANTKSDAEREPIAAAAIDRVTTHADRIFDPCTNVFKEAEDLYDGPSKKQECRKAEDEVAALKAQMIEEIRLKVAEEKAAQSKTDEMTPNDLLKLYHDTSVKIQELLEAYEGPYVKSGGPNTKSKVMSDNPSDMKQRFNTIVALALHAF